MIIVELDRQTFQYDVHSLVKAFYPAEDVKMVEETPADGVALLRLVVSFVMPDAGNGDMEIRPDDPYSEEGLGIGTTVRVRIYEPTEELKTEESVILQTDERKEIKNELKRLLYRVLSAHTNQQLPWGNLTGIRPTKIPMALLEQGWKNPDIASYMRNTYYTSNEKTSLAIAIANREFVCGHSVLPEHLPVLFIQLKSDRHLERSGRRLSGCALQGDRLCVRGICG